ncbi:MAG: leishmanolysin-related zinc metalloendopeptidase [Gemmatimonadota bacterium]
MIGAAIIAACGGSKDITGPPLGTAAGLAMLVQPPTTVAARATLTPAPVVQVIDRAGTPVDTAGVTVTVSIATGSGTLAGTTTAITNGNGQATFSSLNIHGTVGSWALQFTTSGIPSTQSSSLTLTPGTASNLISNSLVSQTSLVSQAVTNVPSVKATDADGNPVSGIGVTFAVTGGGGSLTGGNQTTNGSGVATVGSWTLGAAAGPNSLTASASGLIGSPVNFSATGAIFISNFHIELQFLLPPTASQNAAFTAAAARWEQAITGDLGAFNVGSQPTGTGCGNTTVSGNVNDIRIIVELKPYDGVGQVLGASSPCFLRPSGVGANLPIISYMFFDTADIPALEASGDFGDVVLHEMGHSLGYGTMWGSLVNSLSATNPFFNGTQANSAYINSNGGSALVGGRSAVPLQATGGAGTALAHWEETIFQSEVMTGYITGNVRPFSLTTIESMADLGYVVNPAAADAFNINSQPTLRAGKPDTTRFVLKDDVLQIPIYYIDERTGALTPAPRR